MFPFNVTDTVKSWEQLTIAGAALFILFAFIVVAFVLLMRFINLFVRQQKDESQAKQELAKGLHELAESNNGLRVKFVEVEGKVDRVFTEQVEIKVDQHLINDQLKVLAPAIAALLVPEVKKAISPYFMWLLKELMGELPTIRSNIAQAKAIDAVKEAVKEASSI